MYYYKILYMVLFSTSMYLVIDNWVRIPVGIGLGYSVGLALDDEDKKEDEE